MKQTLYLLLALMLASCVTPEPQTAYWISSTDSKSSANEWIAFQKVFDVKNAPDSAIARIAVDSKYWLWVNGECVIFEGGVKRGPTPYDTYYDSFDLAPHLREGRNNISLLLWHFGKQGFSHNPSGKAGLFFDAKGDRGFSLVSDSTWTARLHPAYYTPTGIPEPNFRLPESNIGFDASKDVVDLHKGGFSFDQAIVLGKEGDMPWGKLRHRTIPLWRNLGEREYVSTDLRKGVEHDTLACRLPYNAQITPIIEFSNAERGKRIYIYTSHHNGGSAYNVSAEYITADGKQSYESLGWMNGETVYYILPKEGVTLERVAYRETSYDTDFAGSFHCNDEFLNRLWEKARRTLLVTMRDTYMDCPDRERAQWWGDAVNESGESFYALCPKSHLITKKGIYELIGWQRKDSTIFSPVPASNWANELPGQMLASVGYYGFWNYYLNTSDLQTIADNYEGVKKYLAVWKREESGIVAFRNGGWTWGDWGSNIDKHGLFNAWYYLALKGAREMAIALGKTDEASAYEQDMTTLKKAFNQVFWNGKAYRHPDYKDDTDDRLQALAVVAGLAEADKYNAIFKTLETTEHASPYMEKYVTEAYFRMGKAAEGIDRMKRRFAKMVNDPQHSTLWEGWGIGGEGYGGGSTNHAWSGGGLTILSQHVCGIAPTTPGYSTFQILPVPAGLTKASATVASVAGEIKAAFNDTDEAFTLSVTIPEGTTATVGIPSEGISTVTGAEGFNSAAAKDHIAYTLPPGEHVLVGKKGNGIASTTVEKGGTVFNFAYDKDDSIDNITFTPIGGGEAMTWKESLTQNHTDAIIILHKGKVVYEKYFGDMTDAKVHPIMSCTKSITALIALALAEEKKLDLNAQATKYVPEMKGTAFDNATVQEVLDMTVSVNFTEDYLSPQSDIVNYGFAAGFAPRPKGYNGALGVREYLLTLKQADYPHGERFIYRTVCTDAIGWIIERASGTSIRKLFEQYIWQKMGMELDASFIVDARGIPISGGGLSAGLRDMARIGEMVRNLGKWHEQQVIPTTAIESIIKGGSKESFAHAGYKTLPNWSYKNFWWISHNEHRAFAARGVRGQTIYIDPKAEMVLVRLASNPIPGNPANDPISLPAYHSIAKYLMEK